jgi:hypothetical protein
MSFLTTQVSLPLWLLILMIAGMIPLLIKIIKLSKRVGFLGKKWRRIDSTMRTISPAEKEKQKSKRATEVSVLKLLAVKGDQGMLLQSIADTLKIDSNTTNHALKYLEGKNMVEIVSSMGGNKYYLSKVGKSYCSKKGYITTVA